MLSLNFYSRTSETSDEIQTAESDRQGNETITFLVLGHH
jgi:hypothetical protein